MFRIRSLRDQLAQVAQKELDAWQQNEEGDDEELGCGGACGLIADAMAGVLAANGIDSTEGGQDGDDHAWLIAYDEETRETAMVDIPPDVYESGAGYHWTKHQDAQIEPDDVVVQSLQGVVNLDDLLGEA